MVLDAFGGGTLKRPKGRAPWRGIDRGRDGPKATPPSKPDRRFSRIRLSSWWSLLQNRHALPWLRLRRSARAAWRRHRPTASIHFSCELFRYAFCPHFRFISLPCLANGTCGSCSCGHVSVLLPPSCPPWLHGRYSLHRYYGDSDSCPAPSSTKAGILDYLTCISRHSVSNHPMRSRLPAILLAPGGLGPRFAFGYRRFFGFRSLLAVSSVASGRIEFVSRAYDARQLYGLSFRFPVALHIPSPVCSYFQLVAGSTATEGLSPSNARSLSSARARPLGRFDVPLPKT